MKSSRSWWRGCGWMSLFVALLFAPTTLAFYVPITLDPPKGEVYLMGGLLLSATERPSGPAQGVGLEFSVHGFGRGKPRGGLGLFGQWQSVNADHDRLCLGLQGTLGYFGLELGVAHELAGATAVATTSMHLAPFASLGLATVSLRVGIPVTRGPGEGPDHGADVGLVVALKLPLRLSGHRL